MTDVVRLLKNSLRYQGETGREHVTGNLHESAHVAFLLVTTPSGSVVQLPSGGSSSRKEKSLYWDGLDQFGAGIGNLALRRPIVDARAILKRDNNSAARGTDQESLDAFRMLLLAENQLSEDRARVKLRVVLEEKSKKTGGLVIEPRQDICLPPALLWLRLLMPPSQRRRPATKPPERPACKTGNNHKRKASVKSSLDGSCNRAIELRMQVRPRLPLRIWRENESASACPPVSRAALPHGVAFRIKVSQTRA
jgi:hypothetical protein